MCFMSKKMNIYPTYISKHNLNHEDTKILVFNEYQKSGLESLIKRIEGCKNKNITIIHKSSAARVGEHIPCWYLMSTI